MLIAQEPATVVPVDFDSNLDHQLVKRIETSILEDRMRLMRMPMLFQMQIDSMWPMKTGFDSMKIAVEVFDLS